MSRKIVGRCVANVRKDDGADTSDAHKLGKIGSEFYLDTTIDIPVLIFSHKDKKMLIIFYGR